MMGESICQLSERETFFSPRVVYAHPASPHPPPKIGWTREPPRGKDEKYNLRLFFFAFAWRIMIDGIRRGPTLELGCCWWAMRNGGQFAVAKRRCRRKLRRTESCVMVGSLLPLRYGCQVKNEVDLVVAG